MRRVRAIVVGLVIGVVLAIPLEAGADGGAYIQFNRTHYLPGDPVVGQGWIYVPENHQDLIDRGPYYAWLVPGGPPMQEGRPLPEGVIRLGEVEFEPYRKTEFELHVAFTMPDVTGAYYTVSICNDPCTVLGFREPLNGPISVVDTPREAELLNETSELTAKTYDLRWQLRKAERKLTEAIEGLDATDGTILGLSAEVSRLERELEAAENRPPVAPTVTVDERPLVEAWALFGLGIALIVGLVTIVLALALARRSAPRLIVPDTIAELEELEHDDGASDRREPAAR